MNIKEVKDLIQEVLRSDICEFELEHTGTKVRLKRGSTIEDSDSRNPAGDRTSIAPPATIMLQKLEESSPSYAAQTEEASHEELHYISSPIVGTFYNAPTPGAEPYVKIGDSVDEGGILCIVEAMKLMNEIPLDVAGEIVRIFVENSQPVEYGQKLFGIRQRK